MKKIISVLFILAITVGSVLAQRKRVQNLPNFDKKQLHFGFYLGSGTMDWDVSHSNKIVGDEGKQYRTDVVNLQPCFTVGVVSNYRLGKNLDLRFLPGMSLSGDRTLDYFEYIEGDNYDENKDPDASFKVRTTYIELPLLLKYKSKRLNNQRPYLIGGVNYRYDVSDVIEASDDDDLLPFKKGGLYLEVGVGLDSYLQFFRLSTELKFSLGLSNMLDDAYSYEDGHSSEYRDALSKLTSNLFQLTFYFE